MVTTVAKSCPHDGRALSPRELSQGTVHRCSACGGLWLPHAVVARLVGLIRFVGGIPHVARQCPDDDTPLRSIAQNGVEMDVCIECGGVWLDAGELERARPVRALDDHTASSDGAYAKGAALDVSVSVLLTLLAGP